MVVGTAPGATIVAAASGWLRALHDVAEPAADYVWIEHPHGEYSKYSGLDLAGTSAEGEWIDSGAPVGVAAEATPGRGALLLWEVAVPASPPLQWRSDDGAAQNASRVSARVCGIAEDRLVPGQHVGAPCENAPPTAAFGGDGVEIDEGEALVFDASASVDPEGAPLTFRWSLPGQGAAAGPHASFPVRDDFEGVVSLTAYDQVEGLADTVSQTVAVRNVPPRVDAVTIGSDEGGVGRVRATVSEPGDDTVTAQIDWGDGSAAQAVTIADLAAGVDHGYGDDGAYTVTVTATDDDGGVGAHAVAMEIASVDPDLVLDVPGTVPFPGGDHAVVAAGATLVATARATDPGTDDLVFTWSNGRGRTFLRDGIAPDAPQSPFGRPLPETATSVEHEFASVGVEALQVSVADDDGARTDASAAVVVTGASIERHGAGWWIHEFSGAGQPDIDPATASAYLRAVAAVSSVFSEADPLTGTSDAIRILSPRGDDARELARAELLCAWLHFASGAISWEDTVTLPSGIDVSFAALMTEAEAAVSSASTPSEELREIRGELALLTEEGQ
nr:PKD domain-containing protein [Microbacterium sp. MF43]